MPEGTTLWIHALLGLLAAAGHLALWLGAFSRVHALGLRRWQLELVEKPVVLALLGLPAAAVLQWAFDPPAQLDLDHVIPGGAAGRGYFWLCCVWGLIAGVNWAWRKGKGPPAQYLRCQREIVPVAGRLPETGVGVDDHDCLSALLAAASRGAVTWPADQPR